jgi:2-amino-4-hydroxy-6-hydroxymethyldihydropteridine diphosphokinase
VTRAVWSLGSNLGDRLEHLRLAVRALSAFDGLRLDAVSGVHETAPWGPVPQGDYLNAVVVTRQDAGPQTLLGIAHVIEAAALRERRERWGPRTLDVDLVTVHLMTGDAIALETDALTLPHPRVHERAFVLLPWLQVEPDAVLPGRGAVRDLLAALPQQDRDGVRFRPDLTLATESFAPDPA